MMAKAQETGSRDWGRMDWQGVAADHGYRRMQRLVHLLPLEGRLLDVGTGRGDGTALLADRPNSIGLDFGLTSLREAAAKHPRVLQADARQLPFGDRAFAVVTCLDVLEHIPGPQRALLEISRVLDVGGLLVLQTPNSEMLKERVLLLARRLGYPQQQSYNKPLPLAAIRASLATAGFGVEREQKVPCWDPRALVCAFSFSRLFFCPRTA